MLQLYMWEYSKEGVQPMVVLKTRRSLRAVHFQPHGTPLLLTAEVRPHITASLQTSQRRAEFSLAHVHFRVATTRHNLLAVPHFSQTSHSPQTAQVSNPCHDTLSHDLLHASGIWKKKTLTPSMLPSLRPEGGPRGKVCAVGGCLIWGTQHQHPPMVWGQHLQGS